MLGEFEYLVIAVSARLGDEAYGASIRHELGQAIGRPCSIGALYTTLDRLEAKSLIKTWMGNSTAERGGRARRMVSVTNAGLQAAEEFYGAISQATRGASWDTLSTRR